MQLSSPPLFNKTHASLRIKISIHCLITVVLEFCIIIYVTFSNWRLVRPILYFIWQLQQKAKPEAFFSNHFSWKRYEEGYNLNLTRVNPHVCYYRLPLLQTACFIHRKHVLNLPSTPLIRKLKPVELHYMLHLNDQRAEVLQRLQQAHVRVKSSDKKCIL